MPRKPYLSLVPNPQRGEIYFGTDFADERPKLQALIAKCILAWSYVEAEMAVLLGEVLRAETPASVAVFQTLRRTATQAASILAGANAALQSEQIELVSAVLNITKAVSSERAALAHGHFGISSKLPDDLIWQDTKNYVSFRTYVSLEKGRWDTNKHNEVFMATFVYQEDDFVTLHKSIYDLHAIYFDLIDYLQSPRLQPETTLSRYSKLCNQPQIAQALAQIRQKNTPLAPSQ
jgi:hypothetical protein